MNPKAQGQSGNITRPWKKVGRGERVREKERENTHKIQMSIFYLYIDLFGLTGLEHYDFLAVVG